TRRSSDLAHITMLQRSPSYVLTVPQQDAMVKVLRALLPQKWAYRIIRGRNVSITLGLFRFCKGFPNAARKLLQWTVKKQLPAGFDMQHFTPKYNPDRKSTRLNSSHVKISYAVFC